MSTSYVLWSILAMGMVTLAIRAAPFLMAKWLRTHDSVQRLGGFLPPAIMALLLVHSLRDLGEQSNANYWPEIVSVLLVLALQRYRRQPLLSIAAGTVLYMALRQWV